MDLSQVIDIIKYTEYRRHISEIDDPNFRYNEISKQDDTVIYNNILETPNYYCGEPNKVINVTMKNSKISNITLTGIYGWDTECTILDNGLLHINCNYYIKYVCINVYQYYPKSNIYRISDVYDIDKYSEVLQYVRKMMPNILLEPLMQIVLDYFIVKAD